MHTCPCKRLGYSLDKHTCDRYCRHLRSDWSQKYVRKCLLQAITACAVPPLSQRGSDRHVFRLLWVSLFFFLVDLIMWIRSSWVSATKWPVSTVHWAISQPRAWGTHRNVWARYGRSSYPCLPTAPSPLRAGIGQPGMVELVRWCGLTGWAVALVQRLSSVCSLSLLVLASFSPLTAAGSYFLLTVWPRLANASLQNLTSSSPEAHLSGIFEWKHLSRSFYRSLNLSRQRKTHESVLALFAHKLVALSCNI